MTIKRWTCVDQQSGNALVDTGYVIASLGPRAVYEDTEGAWVKYEDVKDLIDRKMNHTVNVNVDTESILEGLQGVIWRRLEEMITAQQPELDISELEIAARICDKIAEGSGNSLFRSGAKICALNIRNLANAVSAVYPEVDEEVKRSLVKGMSPEEFAKEYLVMPSPVARLLSDTPKDGYAWSDFHQAFEEKDSTFRDRIRLIYSASQKPVAPPVTQWKTHEHPTPRKEHYTTPPAPPFVKVAEVTSVIPPAPPVYTAYGEYLDRIGGELWDVWRKRRCTMDGWEDLESDDDYRKRIIRRIEMIDTVPSVAVATGTALDFRGSEWGLTREPGMDSPETDAAFRTRIERTIRSFLDWHRGQQVNQSGK